MFSASVVRRSIIVGCVLCLFIATWFGWSHRNTSLSSSWPGKAEGENHGQSVPHSPTKHDGGRQWSFSAAEHAHIHSLNTQQCQSAFGGLFKPIDDAVRRRGSNKIQLPELDVSHEHCMVRGLIFDNEFFVIDAIKPEHSGITNLNERLLGVLHNIDRAVVAASEKIPNVEFTITCDDISKLESAETSIWGMTRQDTPQYKNVWLIPDYTYYTWNTAHLASYASIYRRMVEQEQNSMLIAKRNQLVWRGFPPQNPVRGKLIEVVKDKSWADVVAVDLGSPKPEHYLRIEDHCDYKFVAHTEGVSYSARLKYLQLCKSVVVTHKLVWQEFHTHLMKADGPEQNIVELNDNWDKLDETMLYYLVNSPEKAQMIADRSFDLFANRHLTPAALSCYFRRLFQSWAPLQGFKPKLYRGQGENGKPQRRGLPFATWVLEFMEKEKRTIF